MKPVVCCKCGSSDVVEHVSGEDRRKRKRPYCHKHWAEHCRRLKVIRLYHRAFKSA